MKKIIKNKRYNTDTAKYCGKWTNGQDDDYAVTETLYQKPSGEYFLHGKGGSSSCYSSILSVNCRRPEEVILPLTYEEAREWASEKLTAEEFATIFENDSLKKHKYTFSLTISTHAKILELAAKKDMTKSEVIEWLLTLV